MINLRAMITPLILTLSIRALMKRILTEKVAMENALISVKTMSAEKNKSFAYPYAPVRLPSLVRRLRLPNPVRLRRLPSRNANLAGARYTVVIMINFAAKHACPAAFAGAALPAGIATINNFYFSDKKI